MIALDGNGTPPGREPHVTFSQSHLDAVADAKAFGVQVALKHGLPVASCRCGKTTVVGDGFGAGRCPFCASHLADHDYWDAGSDSYGDPILRCMDCDGRPHSHGMPVGADRSNVHVYAPRSLDHVSDCPGCLAKLAKEAS
jgi:hypothetical protein